MQTKEENLEKIDVKERLLQVMAEHCGFSDGIKINDLFKEVYNFNIKDFDDMPYFLEHYYNKLVNAIKYINSKKLAFIRKKDKLYFNLKTTEDADYNKQLMLRMIKNATTNIKEAYDYVNEEKWRMLQLKKRKKLLVPQAY